ncbi:hypothetical protein FRC10_002853 [Ceratobasidium sp. 414]|nr:hypothetical protein FRC10_002853 [Ceratobasidium sp. 414]
MARSTVARLQAGLIDSFGGLDRLPRVLAKNTNYPWETQAPALHDKYIQQFLDYFTSDLGFGFRSHGNWQIEWCAGTRGDDRACLPVIGGFAFRDAEFVLRQLFEHRDVFLECGFRTKALGWSILVYVIQCLLDDRWFGKPSVPELWKKQYHIVYRYALISGARADVFMELVCGRFMAQYHEHFACLRNAIDFNDAELIQLAYGRKFRPNQKGTHKLLDLSYLIVITDYTRDNVLGYPPLELYLVETTLEITWDVLLCIGKPKADERWTIIDVFMRKNFGWKAYFTITEEAYASMTHIGAAMRKVLLQADTLRFRMEEYYPDWYKTLLFLRQEKGRYDRNSSMYPISVKSEAAWVGFGRELGFTEHLKPGSAQRRCTYARCADPDGAQFESEGRRYCNTRCQAA